MKLVICGLILVAFLLAGPGLRAGGAESLPTTDTALADIPASAGQVRPLLIGHAAPAMVIRTVDGKAFNLNEAIKRQLAVLIIYRGNWVPHCNTQMGQLQVIENQLRRMVYQILAISPGRPEKLHESLVQHQPAYTLLSDSEMKAARAFGIAFREDQATMQKY